jgi:dTDP-4-amino-4,6-dideoxygalactose transaminase
VFVSNGMTALQLSVKALNLTGEIITTPFSYVATTGVVLWENCTPVFADVRPSDLTIDPAQVEAAITPRTTAILATHVYGYPCAVDELERIARRHKLKVIYDAAHAFGCRLRGKSLAAYGDVSCLSFHATKVFHTVEGGAVVVNSDPPLADRVKLMRAFGHFGDTHHCIGINGKNSELHAAMGLCNLPRVGETIARRRAVHERYQALMRSNSLRQPMSDARDFEYNHAYFPVLLSGDAAVVRALAKLAEIRVFPRRYFYPSLNTLPYVKARSCPVAERAALSVLCLPVSEDVTPDVQERTIAVLSEAQRT